MEASKIFAYLRKEEQAKRKMIDKLLANIKESMIKLYMI